MLTEEQIQRLVKKLSEEYELDETICEKNVRFIDTISEVFMFSYPKHAESFTKKSSKENSLKVSFKGVSV